jgi:hypothetical protein
MTVEGSTGPRCLSAFCYTSNLSSRSKDTIPLSNDRSIVPYTSDGYMSACVSRQIQCSLLPSATYRRMNRLVGYRGVSSGILQNNLFSTWVFGQELHTIIRSDGSIWSQQSWHTSVTSYAAPAMITQHESLELCAATSSPVSILAFGSFLRELISRFRHVVL